MQNGIKVVVFGTEHGKPLKIKIGEQKFQFACGTHEVEKGFAEQITRAYKDNVKYAVANTAAVVADVAVLATPTNEVKAEQPIKEEKKRGRPKKS